MLADETGKFDVPYAGRGVFRICRWAPEPDCGFAPEHSGDDVTVCAPVLERELSGFPLQQFLYLEKIRQN